jgi:hypothetical protein
MKLRNRYKILNDDPENLPKSITQLDIPDNASSNHPVITPEDLDKFTQIILSKLENNHEDIRLNGVQVLFEINFQGNQAQQQGISPDFVGQPDDITDLFK